MNHVSGPGSSALWPLTVRQRIRIYLILAAIAALACGGVDYEINANGMDCNIVTKDQIDCNVAGINHHCKNVSYADGKCHLIQCIQPCDALVTPVVNCPFGRKNGSVPWTQADCRSQITLAGCTSGTLYSFGCYGYNCTDQRCGRH